MVGKRLTCGALTSYNPTDLYTSLWPLTTKLDLLIPSAEKIKITREGTLSLNHFRLYFNNVGFKLINTYATIGI